MSEKEKQDIEKKTLSLKGTLKLSGDIEKVKQKNSPGTKSKTIVVEIKKSKNKAQPLQSASVGKSSHSRMRASTISEKQKKEETLEEKAISEEIKKTAAESNLTESEKEARLHALRSALKNASENAKKVEERLKKEAELAQKSLEKKEQQTALLNEEDASDQDEGAKEEACEQVQDIAISQEKQKVPEEVAPIKKQVRYGFEKESEGTEKKSSTLKAKKSEKNVVSRQERRIRRTKLTITQALSGSGDEEQTRSLASIRRAREKERQKQQESNRSKVYREVVIPDAITVQELANRMAEQTSDVIKCLMKMGIMMTATQTLDSETAQIIVEELGHTAKRVTEEDIEENLAGEIDETPEDFHQRPPVVTIMGHVDHGKTSLLDALRSTDVVSGEAGGITQHIGAYQITTKKNHKITFIDTPGHAAFTEMRSRGADITDIVILVVAADDGLKEQTIEAINHAKAAQVPIVVAINKIDKPNTNIDKLKSDLLIHEIFLEDMGGDVLSVEVSAKNKINLDKLEEAILLQAEMLDLKSNSNRPAEGYIIEAKLEKGRGPVATVLVTKGTLKVGDVFVAGAQWGKVRAMIDEKYQRITEAFPSSPVEILGFDGPPEAGDVFSVAIDENRAREVAIYRHRKKRDKVVAQQEKDKMGSLFSKSGENSIKSLSVIIKSDVQGSSEALQSSLNKLSNEEVEVQILHTGVGGINESDITLAKASNAIILGFNVRANAQAREIAQKDKVEIRYYSIIYDVINDIKALMSGMLSPILKENFLGKADVRDVFKITKVGKVAGCFVTEGLIRRNSKARILRDNVVVFEGNLDSLKRFKDEVKEVKEGFECGISFAGFQDIRPGDVIECCEIEKIARTVD